MSEGSGSGESDNDFFLPSFHYHYGKVLKAACIFPKFLIVFSNLHSRLLYLVAVGKNDQYVNKIILQLWHFRGTL